MHYSENAKSKAKKLACSANAVQHFQQKRIFYSFSVGFSHPIDSILYEQNIMANTSTEDDNYVNKYFAIIEPHVLKSVHFSVKIRLEHFN